MQIPQFLLGVFLGLGLLSAQAGPTAPNYAGSPGDTVTVILSEENANIPFGMVINFTYDKDVLTLNTVRAGSMWVPLPSPPEVPVLSLFTDDASGTAMLSGLPIVNGTGPLLELDFTIDQPPADQAFPYITVVTFECAAPASGSSNNCDYPFVQDTSTITIDRQNTPIPLPGTLPLIALGMATLMWARRRTA